jgi:2-oxoglutarate ferredoxin oxidoreductase subunit gamma
MHEEFLLSGFGGQGILFCGKLLAHTGMHNGLEVTFMPSYGAEVRGGTAHCHVVLADRPIASPVVDTATVAVTMNSLAMDKFMPYVRPGGLLVVNSSLCEEKPSRADIDVLEVPATQMADDLGDIRVANMVILGALLAKKPIYSLEQVQDALVGFLPERKKAFLPINQRALKAGYGLNATAPV